MDHGSIYSTQNYEHAIYGDKIVKKMEDKMKQYLDESHGITMKWYLFIGWIGATIPTFLKTHGEEIVLTAIIGFTGAFFMGLGKLLIDLLSRLFSKKDES